MVRLRGEEQSGFLDVVETWLARQPWFPVSSGRRRLTRVGGLRLPVPAGDADPQLNLEMHVLEVQHTAGVERVAVPMALRGRPSALAGKDALIGRLSTPTGDVWVYDGAKDRAFLASWLEMARRQQGSRNGRSRGEAFSGFDAWPAFSAQLQRRALDTPAAATSRTAVRTDDDGSGTREAVVDFIRRPGTQRSPAVDTVLRMTRTGSKTVSRVLGVVTGSWPEINPGTGESHWVSGDLGIIREASLGSADAAELMREALAQGVDFTAEAAELGLTLGNFHADLAATFGAYPQTSAQLNTMAARAETALQEQWQHVRRDLDESEATDLGEVVDLLGRQLRDADQTMTLQKIHGDMGVSRLHRGTAEHAWVIDEDGGMLDHALSMRDVVTVLMSCAELVMQSAHDASLSPEDEAAPAEPVDLGLWYEQVSRSLLQGYRDSDAEGTGVDSVFFHVAMLTEALELFHRWDGQWVFRPSMLLQSET